jgi:hypothetical protein
VYSIIITNITYAYTINYLVQEMEYPVYHFYKKTILGHHLSSYNFPHMLPTTTSVTSLEDWRLLKVLTFIFLNYMTVV